MESLDVLTTPVLELLKKANLLKPLIRHELIQTILDEVILSDKEISDIDTIIMNTNEIKSDKEYAKWKESNQTQFEESLKEISIPFKLNNHALNHFSHMTEAKYLEKKDYLDQVTYSLLRVNKAFLAQELYQRILEKEADFKDLAAEFSLGPEKNTCGIVGPIPISQNNKDLVSILKSSKINEVNKPIQIGNLFVIIRVEARIISSLNQDTKLLLSKELLNEWLDEEANKVETNLSKSMEFK